MLSLIRRFFTRSNGSQRYPFHHRRPALEVLEDRVALSPVHGEFHINTRTAGVQAASATASSANNRSIVVWDDALPNGNIDIRAQIYGANGRRIGKEFVVDHSAKSEFSPSVAMDKQGDFVVVWVRQDSSQDVFGARFSAGGSRVGKTFTVAKSTLDESQPSVAADAAGNFVVAYTVDLGGANGFKEVDVRMFSKSAKPVLSFAVPNRGDFESEPSVARNSAGLFGIAYLARSSTVGVHDQIILAAYTASGGLRGTLTVSDQNLQTGEHPSLAVNDLGNAVVAWQETDFGDAAVVARQISSQGDMGNVMSISSVAGVQQITPSVVMGRKSNNFIVAYTYEDSSTQYELRARRVSAAGDKSPPIFFGSNRQLPSLGIRGDGYFFLTYTRQNAASDPAYGIFGQFGKL
jgi:hypothetical protein